MWQETKHGLYKQFNFEDFKQAWSFMEKIAVLAEEFQHHPRWENEWSVVQIWLITHEGGKKITEKDHELAKAIDALLVKNEEVKQSSQVASTSGKIKVFADGGSRGNPGPSACGYILTDENNKVLVDKGVYLGVTTNNQAEYQALKLALEEAQKMRAEEVDVHMDSMLVINQMKGIFKVKNRDLWPIHDEIKHKATTFKHISYTHVPRELNKLADAAVNRALDEELKINKGK